MARRKRKSEKRKKKSIKRVLPTKIVRRKRTKTTERKGTLDTKVIAAPSQKKNQEHEHEHEHEYELKLEEQERQDNYDNEDEVDHGTYESFDSVGELQLYHICIDGTNV
mmetsp:Transcript_40255/g.46326  ORF Transcript_40255/g.46326 Transcript_40255/m.46326 type:complete len:109 (-) Transcript_40255:733-1059(-)